VRHSSVIDIARYTGESYFYRPPHGLVWATTDGYMVNLSNGKGETVEAFDATLEHYLEIPKLGFSPFSSAKRCVQFFSRRPLRQYKMGLTRDTLTVDQIELFGGELITTENIKTPIMFPLLDSIARGDYFTYPVLFKNGESAGLSRNLALIGNRLVFGFEHIGNGVREDTVELFPEHVEDTVIESLLLSCGVKNVKSA
jgi:hypothetical protein